MLPLVVPPRSQTLQILKKICNFCSSGCNFASFQYFLDRLDVLDSSNRVDYRNEEKIFFCNFEKKYFFWWSRRHFWKFSKFRQKNEIFSKILDKTFLKNFFEILSLRFNIWIDWRRISYYRGTIYPQKWVAKVVFYWKIRNFRWFSDFVNIFVTPYRSDDVHPGHWK